MKLASSQDAILHRPITDQECSFQKPTENEFNFGSSIPDKNIVKQKKIHDDDHDGLPEYNIKNLIVNKLYDQCSDNNNFDSKPFFSHECNNSCKSYVDIIGGSLSTLNGNGDDKIRVSVKDCDCKENRKNRMLSQLNHLDNPISIVENRGYGADCKNNKLSNNSAERILTTKDLLSFALQIATGMVSSHWSGHLKFIFFIKFLGISIV